MGTKIYPFKEQYTLEDYKEHKKYNKQHDIEFEFSYEDLDRGVVNNEELKDYSEAINCSIKGLT